MEVLLSQDTNGQCHYRRPSVHDIHGYQGLPVHRIQHNCVPVLEVLWPLPA